MVRSGLLRASLVFVLLSSALPRSGAAEESPARLARSVLFVGNSYTYVNDLPGTLRLLAEAGGHELEVASIAPSGVKLLQHAQSPETRDLIAAGDGARWDWVVLQEQSQNPATAYRREHEMYPAARALVELVRRTRATPLLYMTWGRKHGCHELALDGYAAMQDAIAEGYLGLAGELHVPVAPVGVAWRAAVEARPELELWRTDGSHPSPAGTYLAACVFYASIFRTSPEGLAFHGNLSEEDAASLQRIAAHVVLSQLGRWNLAPPAAERAATPSPLPPASPPRPDSHTGSGTRPARATPSARAAAHGA